MGAWCGSLRASRDPEQHAAFATLPQSTGPDASRPLKTPSPLRLAKHNAAKRNTEKVLLSERVPKDAAQAFTAQAASARAVAAPSSAQLSEGLCAQLSEGLCGPAAPAVGTPEPKPTATAVTGHDEPTIGYADAKAEAVSAEPARASEEPRSPPPTPVTPAAGGRPAAGPTLGLTTDLRIPALPHAERPWSGPLSGL